MGWEIESMALGRKCHNKLIQQTAVQLNYYNKLPYLEEVAIYSGHYHCMNTDDKL
jgi:hypothetical protein